jgi:hypothetical protein
LAAWHAAQAAGATGVRIIEFVEAGAWTTVHEEDVGGAGGDDGGQDDFMHEGAPVDDGAMAGVTAGAVDTGLLVRTSRPLHPSDYDPSVPTPVLTPEEVEQAVLAATNCRTRRIINSTDVLEHALAEAMRDAGALHARCDTVLAAMVSPTPETCSICAVSPSDTVYPCGHCMCVGCAIRLRRQTCECPYCKRPAAAVLAVTTAATAPKLPLWVRRRAGAGAGAGAGEGVEADEDHWAAPLWRCVWDTHSLSSLGFWIACTLQRGVVDGDGCALIVADKILTLRAVQHAVAGGAVLPRGWPRLRTLAGTVTEKEALARAFVEGHCHLCVTVADVTAGLRFAKVPVLIPLCTVQPTSALLTDQLLRQLKPGKVRAVHWCDEEPCGP